MSQKTSETPYIETEFLLAVLSEDEDWAKMELAKLSKMSLDALIRSLDEASNIARGFRRDRTDPRPEESQ